MASRKHWNLPIAVLLFYQSALAIASAEPRIERSAPRDYGYVMGDLVENTLTATLPQAYTLEAGRLPSPGALDQWLDVHSVTWDRERQGNEARYRIRIIYQIFKGVRTAEKAVVPALPLRFIGPGTLETKAPPWEFTVMPLIPPDLADETVVIREAHPPQALATAPHRRRLLAGLAGFSVVSAFLARQRLGGRRRALPFRRAQRELKKLLRAPASPETLRQAARLLHRALDETAGAPVFAGQIEGFLVQRPAFTPVRDELREFFALSQRLFFAVPEASASPEYPPSRLAEFCRRCAAAERRAP